MNERFDDGGSAFAWKYGNGFGSDGMTLLDYFAGQIAAGQEAYDGDSWDMNHSGFATYCYDRAAAMIRRKRELERGEQ